MAYTARADGNVWVSLTAHEIRRACEIGRLLWEKSHADGRSDRDGYSGFTNGGDAGLRQQMLGALAERVAAKGLGVYWPESIDGFSDPDLPHNIEVRLVGADHYGLRVYPRTPNTRRVVGVVIPKGHERGPYRMPGWIVAADAKRDEWQMAPHGRPPMFAVPQNDLRPMAWLQTMIASELHFAAPGSPGSPTVAERCPHCGTHTGDVWVFPQDWLEADVAAWWAKKR